MEKILATVGILTYNSAPTLERTLQSVAGFDDILISDGGSTDGTLDIARKYGARVISQTVQGKIEDYGKEKQRLIENAKHDWIFILDSDETVSRELVSEIAAIVRENKAPYVYRVPMGLTLDGKGIRCFSSLPGYQTRFFSRKSGAHFVKPIHERIKFDPQPVGTLTGQWFVHWNRSNVTFGKYLERDAKLGSDQPLLKFIRWKIWHNLRGALYISAYTLLARLTHKPSDCAPLGLEWQKIAYKLKHILLSIKYRYS